MTDLKVPYGQDIAGNLVAIADADRQEGYFCPGCGVRLVVKAGSINVRHFAHKSSETCTQETITHKTAKLLVKKEIELWLSGKRTTPITIDRKCQHCHRGTPQRLPATIDAVALEYVLADGFIADVALLFNGKPIADIEIRVAHPVDEEKASKISIRFIEIDGYDVVAHPAWWTVLGDNLPPYICAPCLEKQHQRAVREREVSTRSKVSCPEGFTWKIDQCWRCSNAILIFNWPGKTHWGGDPPPAPMPRTVQYRYSATVEHKYWANTCPYCKALQGDNFIDYDDPEFKALLPRSTIGK